VHPLIAQTLAGDRIRDMHRRAAARRLVIDGRAARASVGASVALRLAMIGGGGRRSARKRHPSHARVVPDGCGAERRLCL
jgi:hypothetical protein